MTVERELTRRDFRRWLQADFLRVPARMAAYIISEPGLLDSGSRIMRAGDLGSCRSTVSAIEVRRGNRDIMDA